MGLLEMEHHGFLFKRHAVLSANGAAGDISVKYGSTQGVMRFYAYLTGYLMSVFILEGSVLRGSERYIS